MFLRDAAMSFTCSSLSIISVGGLGNLFWRALSTALLHHTDHNLVGGGSCLEHTWGQFCRDTKCPGRAGRVAAAALGSLLLLGWETTFTRAAPLHVAVERVHVGRLCAPNHTQDSGVIKVLRLSWRKNERKKSSSIACSCTLSFSFIIGKNLASSPPRAYKISLILL